MPDRLRVLYVASYRDGRYVRQHVIRRILRKMSDVELTECVHNGRSPFRYVRTVVGLLRLMTRRFDVIVLGFRGQELLPVVRLLARGPIVFDAFVSLYQTWCNDRNTFLPNSAKGRFVRWYDRLCCRIADRVMLDTGSHADYFSRTFGISRDRIIVVPVGADDSVFTPRDSRATPGPHTVFFYGTYLPVHGATVIVEAAQILQHRPDIRFIMVGDGREKAQTLALAERFDLRNIEFISRVSLEKLAELISESEVCLGGHFSKTEKASMVIAGKTFQFLAMRRATIVGDNRANRELLTDRTDCRMVAMGDPADLARVIAELCDDAALRNRIAANGHDTYITTMRLVTDRVHAMIRSYGPHA